MKMSLYDFWVHGPKLVWQYQCILCLVYSFFCIFSGWWYPFVQGHRAYGLRLWEWLYYYHQSSGELSAVIILNNRLWLQYITNESFIGTPCRLNDQHCWQCMLITRDLTAALDTSEGWTVGWRLRHLAAILSISVVLLVPALLWMVWG